MNMFEKLLQIEPPQIKRFIDIYIIQSIIKKVALATFCY